MKFAALYGLQPGLSFEETILRTRKAGYEGIELSTKGFLEGRARPLEEREMGSLLDGARQCGDCARKAGLEVIGFAPPYFCMSYFETPVFKNYYRLAQAMGSPSLKIFGILYDTKQGYWPLFRKTQEMLKKLIEYGEHYGVRSLLELHSGNLNESCSGAYLIMKDFAPKLIGVIHDPQNMVTAGKETWQLGIEILGDYLAYVHWKDMYFVRNEQNEWTKKLSRPGEGLVNWKEFIHALKTTGFKGYLCNENLMEKAGVPSEEYMEGELAYMKSLVS